MGRPGPCGLWCEAVRVGHHPSGTGKSARPSHRPDDRWRCARQARGRNCHSKALALSTERPAVCELGLSVRACNLMKCRRAEGRCHEKTPAIGVIAARRTEVDIWQSRQDLTLSSDECLLRQRRQNQGYDRGRIRRGKGCTGMEAFALAWNRRPNVDTGVRDVDMLAAICVPVVAAVFGYRRHRNHLRIGSGIGWLGEGTLISGRSYKNGSLLAHFREGFFYEHVLGAGEAHIDDLDVLVFHPLKRVEEADRIGRHRASLFE